MTKNYTISASEDKFYNQEWVDQLNQFLLTRMVCTEDSSGKAMIDGAKFLFTDRFENDSDDYDTLLICLNLSIEHST